MKAIGKLISAVKGMDSGLRNWLWTNINCSNLTDPLQSFKTIASTRSVCMRKAARKLALYAATTMSACEGLPHSHWLKDHPVNFKLNVVTVCIEEVQSTA
jgi:hypothetical protein